MSDTQARRENIVRFVQSHPDVLAREMLVELNAQTEELHSDLSALVRAGTLISTMQKPRKWRVM